MMEDNGKDSREDKELPVFRKEPTAEEQELQQTDELSPSAAASTASMALSAMPFHACGNDGESDSPREKIKVAPASARAAPFAARGTPSPTSPRKEEVNLDPKAAPSATPSDTLSISPSSAIYESPDDDPLHHLLDLADEGISSTPGSKRERRTTESRREKRRREKTEKMGRHEIQHRPPPLPYRLNLPESKEHEHSPGVLETQFHEFLMGGEAFKSSNLVGSFLNIDFMHILAKNKDLAMLICNEEPKWSQTWLIPAVEMFVREKGCAANKVSPHFINKPEWIFTAKELLSSPHDLTVIQSLFCGKEDILIATPHLSILFTVVLWGILDELEKRNSWDGKLIIDDLFIMKMQGQIKLLIMKDPYRKGCAELKDSVLDVKSLWQIMEPFIVSSDGALPLYFDELKQDLTSVTLTDLGFTWFQEYLRYHPAFASSTSRKYLLIDLHQNSMAFRFHRKSKDFRELFESDQTDYNWCDAVESDQFLRHTFHYKKNLLKKKLVFNSPAEVTVILKKQKITKGENVPTVGFQTEVEEIVYNYPKVVMVQRLFPDQVVQDAGKKCEADEKEGGDLFKLGMVVDQQEGKGLGNPQEEVAVSWGVEQGTTKLEFETDETKVGEDTGKLGQVLEQQMGKELGKPHEVDDAGTGETKFAEDAVMVGQAAEAKLEEDPEPDLDEYSNNIGSLLKFSRNSLSHTEEHVSVSDLTDVEMYGAGKNSWFLPRLIKEFLRICNMQDRLHNTWSDYKASIEGRLLCLST